MQCNFLHPRNTVLNSEPGAVRIHQRIKQFTKSYRFCEDSQTTARTPDSCPTTITVGPVAARIPKNQRSKRTRALINFQYHTRSFVERPWSQAEYSIRADSPELTLSY